MKKPGTLIYVTLGALVLVGAGLTQLVWDGRQMPLPPSPADSTVPAPTAAPTVTVGTATTRESAPATTLPGTASPSSADPALRAGPAATMSDPVPAAYVKQAASVMEALQHGDHPERLSPHYLPAKFDAERFAAEPNYYLDIVEPGRIYDTAEATGPESVHLVLEGPETVTVPENGSTQLVVFGVPHSPVTYTTMHGGFFDNKMASITVLSDANGRAAVTYTAFMNIADVGICIGSPMSVGTISMTVEVLRQRDVRAAQANATPVTVPGEADRPL
jgi:hypothetical protein